MGAAAGDAPQFIPVLQLWAAWTFRTQLPDATEAGQQFGPQSQKQEVTHFKPGQVHYTTLEGIPEGAPVMAGTFSVNGYPVSILFDSGASHTFISKECAIRLGLKIESMPKPSHIYSPGGKLITNQFVKQVPLQLQGKFFPTVLIMLPTQRVDIIVGMN